MSTNKDQIKTDIIELEKTFNERWTAAVKGDELLAAVMQKLIDTGRPVLVESPSGGFIGAIDDSLAVRALSVPSSS